MGTKIHCESYLPVYHSMRDLNEDSSSSSWPVCYGQYYNTVDNLCPGSNKDALKQKMLEHEAVFKDQVYELHRLYRRQRDMMEEARRKSLEPSTSSSHQGSQVPSEDARKWHMAGFPMSNDQQLTHQNGLDSTRPLKVRKKLFNLQLPPDECIDVEEGEKVPEVKGSNLSTFNAKLYFGGPPVPEPDCRIVASSSTSQLRNTTGLADLNEPIVIEEMKPDLYKVNGGYEGVNGDTTHARNAFLTGSGRSNLGNHGLHQDKLPISSHFNRPNHPYSSGRCKEDSWRAAHRSYLFSGSCLASSPASSWMKPESSSTQKITAPELNLSFGRSMTVNGFYQGSTSGSKDLKAPLSSGFDYHSLKNDHVNNGFWNFQKGSGHVDSKPPVLDINLNEVFTDPVSRNGKGKREDHFPTLPWLKHKTGDLNQPIVPEVEVLMNKEIEFETQNVTKILGVPVFEKMSPSLDIDDKGRKRRVIDINLECVPEEEDVILEKEKRAKVDSIREYIDLNFCASECEDHPVSSSYQSDNFRTPLDIDLEAPAVPDEDSEADHEVVRNAAETMVAISSFCPNKRISSHPEASLAESLLSFANEMMVFRSDFSIDEFEATTLRLQETKEEDYMPSPFIPEIQKVEEPGTNALTRSRRGPSRRGRPRRDFQRDILPGMATMSRHEVSEDVQIFTGLMRAMGHCWGSGVTRRNGTKTRGGRGRQRQTGGGGIITSHGCSGALVVNVEGGLEDRSLRGWGKTTRRLRRRQRCPAGNHTVAVVST